MRPARWGNRPVPRGSTWGLSFLAGLCLTWAGCAEQVRSPSPAELARFQAADSANPALDMDRVLQARIATGPYRATPGDVLRLEMPRFLEQSSEAAATDSRQTYNCRIGDDGTIVLPIVGRLAVGGKSLAEIETAIATQYYPKYVAAPLPVYAGVLEYKTQRVSIVGAVAQPGIHALRYDQMSLVALLMQAGGIAGPGAAVIRITRANGQPAGPLLEDARPKIVPSSVLRPAAYQIRSPAPRALFEREGPLRTTGWLEVGGENGAVARREWLDLGNEPQRRQFLAALSAQSNEADLADLGARFAQLGAYLEDTPKTEDDRRTSGADTARVAPIDDRRAVARLVSSDGHRSTSDDSSVATATASRFVPGLPPGWRAVGQGSFTTAAIPVRAAANGPDGAVMSAAAERKDPNEGSASRVETLVLPVRGLNIPFADVALAEGDTVVVEPPREQSITIVGLVTRPGNMPYPPGARYTLIEAIGFAGGLDLVADPRYVNVYRLAPDGEIVGATFQLVNPDRQQQLTEALALPLRPGDVVSVEHTARTRTNVFFDRVFRLSLGLYVDPLRLWDNNND